jgi:hypothetical protein
MRAKSTRQIPSIFLPVPGANQPLRGQPTGVAKYESRLVTPVARVAECKGVSTK